MRLVLMKALIIYLFLQSIVINGAEPSAEATLAARKYIDQLKKGEARQAATDCWDNDALLSKAFGLMYLDLPEAERKRAQNALVEFLAIPFDNEKMIKLFKTLEVKEATPTRIDDSTFTVRIQLVGDEGKFNTVNTLLLEKKGDYWKITDQRQGNQPSIRAAHVMTYLGNVKGPTDTIPVVLERVISDIQKQMNQK